MYIVILKEFGPGITQTLPKINNVFSLNDKCFINPQE